MKRWIALASSLVLVGCAPTETGNPSLTTTGLALSAYSSDSSRVAIGSQPGALSIDLMWVSIASIDLDPCDGQPRVTAVAGPFSEDLASRPRSVHDLDTELDRFCGLAMGTTPAADDPDGGVPNELVGQTIVVHGQRADSVPFRISSAHPSSLALLVPDGVGVRDQPRRFLVAFDVVQLVASLDFAGAVVGGDGTIHIDVSNNPTLLSSFEGNIDGSASLHRDLDRDGELDPDESAHINH